MSFTTTILSIVAVFLLAIGQVLFKICSSDFAFSLKGVLKGFLSIKFTLAIAVYLVASVMWIFVLKTVPLRIAYPFTSLAFILVPVLSHFILGENISWNTFAGACFIGIGILISIYK